jgi:AsmA protein
MLDISPYSSEFALVDGAAGRWRREPIDLAGLVLSDLDIRLSAADTTMDKVKLGRVAASIVATNGVLEASLGEAAAYGGTLKGRLTMATVGEIPKFDASFSFEEVEMGKALGDFLAFRRLEGIGKGSLDVSAVGRSIEDLTASLVGQASVSVRNGALIGVDLADVMRRIERRPLTAVLEPRSGRTVFETGTASFAIAGGVARTSDARFDGGALSVALDGSAGVAARDLDLSGRASFASGDPGSRFTLPFKITGQWDSPSVSPDPDALIRRSGAAAPLLHGNASAFADTANGEKHNDENPLRLQSMAP